MTKTKKIISLLLALMMVFAMTACSSGPDYSADDALKNGYKLFTATDDAKREFTVNIVQGSGYEYTITGRINEGRILGSLTVVHNGLKSNYKNLFIFEGENLYINMNSAMSVAEDQVDFIFSESTPLQGKWLVLPGASNLLNTTLNSFKDTMSGITSARANKESVKGDCDLNFVYNVEDAKGYMTTATEKHEANKSVFIKNIDDFIKTTSADSFETYEKAMQYLNDCIDIDTEEITGEHDSLGTKQYESLLSEMRAVSNLLSIEGAELIEGITHNAGAGYFKHSFTMKQGDQIFGKIVIEVSTKPDVASIKHDLNRSVDVPTFLDCFLTNVKNAKGVGYETSDFPYEITYNEDSLTVTETTGLYTATHLFVFRNQTLVSYTVTYSTYERYMHDALKSKCKTLGLSLVSESTESLGLGNGAGYLQYATEAVPARFAASGPVELLKIIQEIGVPSYDNFV